MSNLHKADQALSVLVVADNRVADLARTIEHINAAGGTVSQEVRAEYARARVAAAAAEDAYLAAADALAVAS